MQQTGSVQGGVRYLLQAEGLAVFLASLFYYRHLGDHWSTFALLFFAPDLTFIAYLANSAVGAVAYDIAHTYVLPVGLLCVGLLHPALLPYALIWTAHIGFDRALGYGLKYRKGFNHTHLSVVGRAGV